MRKVLNYIYKHQSLIYKILLFVFSVVFIVYLFPKGGSFKYKFEKGKVWQYDNLYAPFDFAIKKTEEELNLEKQEVIDNAFAYFDLDSQVEIIADNNYENQFTANFSDSIPSINRLVLFQIGKEILENVYDKGILDKIYNYWHLI